MAVQKALTNGGTGELHVGASSFPLSPFQQIKKCSLSVSVVRASVSILLLLGTIGRQHTLIIISI